MKYIYISFLLFLLGCNISLKDISKNTPNITSQSFTTTYNITPTPSIYFYKNNISSLVKPSILISSQPSIAPKPLPIPTLYPTPLPIPTTTPSNDKIIYSGSTYYVVNPNNNNNNSTNIPNNSNNFGIPPRTEEATPLPSSLPNNPDIFSETPVIPETSENINNKGLLEFKLSNSLFSTSSTRSVNISEFKSILIKKIKLEVSPVNSNNWIECQINEDSYIDLLSLNETLPNFVLDIKDLEPGDYKIKLDISNAKVKTLDNELHNLNIQNSNITFNNTISINSNKLSTAIIFIDLNNSTFTYQGNKGTYKMDLECSLYKEENKQIPNEYLRLFNFTPTQISSTPSIPPTPKIFFDE